MEIPGFSTYVYRLPVFTYVDSSHIEGPSSVPPSQPHALNEDDWFQIEEDGHAGDVGGQWSTEFFSQFDGSSRFPQQDDMEVDAQSLPYQIPGSTLNIQGKLISLMRRTGHTASLSVLRGARTWPYL